MFRKKGKSEPESKKPCGIKIVPQGTLKCMYDEDRGFYYFGQIEFIARKLNFPRGELFSRYDGTVRRICGMGEFELQALMCDLMKEWTEDTIEAVRAEMDAWVEEVKAFFEADFGGTITVEYEPIAEACEDEPSKR